MTNLEEITALTDAIKIIHDSRLKVGTQCDAIWSKSHNAQMYLNKQVAALIAAPEAK
jgi:hypothetical protein